MSRDHLRFFSSATKKISQYSFRGSMRLFHRFWCLSMVFLLLSLYVVSSWSGLVATAYAANLPLTSSSATSSSLAANSTNTPFNSQAMQSSPAQKHMAAQVSSSQPWDVTGDVPFYTYVGQRLDDRLDFKVNVANGNLLVHSHDAQVTDIGLNLDADHFYNSLGWRNWTLNYGAELYIGDSIVYGLGNISYYGPTGETISFVRNSNGTYPDPPGLNASLTVSDDGNNTSYTLTFHQTGLKYIFNSSDSSSDGFATLQDISDKNGNAISIDNSGGEVIGASNHYGGFTFKYNSSSNLTQLTDQINHTVNYGYDSNNNLTSITDLNGKVTTYGYTNNVLTSITDPLGHTTGFSYISGTSQINKITDAAGNTVQFAYHASSDSACSGIVSPALPCTVVTDKNGHSTTYAYNSNSQVTSTKDALGHITSQSFDALNYNVTQQQDALTDMSTFTFSPNNNLTTSTDGSGATTSLTYPASGSANQYYPLSQTDPQGNTSNYAYDSNGNMLSATDQTSNTGLTYTYTSAGEIATQKDTNGNVTTYTYAPISGGLCGLQCPPPKYTGNLTTIAQPSPLGQTTFTYDTANRINSLTDGNNHKTTFTYDTMDRITKITYSDGSTISYTYDNDGNLLTEIDKTGTTRFTYDKLNRELKKTLPNGTIVTSTYDKIGNLASINDGTGVVSYTYDAANRMTTLIEPNGRNTLYGYDNANRKISIQYPNGTGMLMTYDGAGHELTNTGGVMNAQGQITTTYDHFVYTYMQGSKHVALLQNVSYLDPVGQSATYTRNYSYNSKNELTGASILNSSQSQVNNFTYSYDANGNIKSKQIAVGSVSISYSYNAANELTSSISGSTTTNYTYDGNGNLTGSSNGPSFTYNALNQTTAIGSNSYAYSGTNQTDRVTVNGNTDVYSTLGLSSEHTSSGTTAYVRCSCGLLNDERLSNGKEYYYLFDGLGSVVGMTDSSGHDVNRYDYDPYGNMFNQQEQSGINNPWKYAGGYLDSSTGLYKYGIRYYDPTTGRWTQRTPVGGSLQETLKANPYVYAGDNPANEVDPSGADAIDCYLAEAGLVVAGGVALAAAGAIIVADPPLAGALLFFAWTGVGGGVASLAIGAIQLVRAGTCKGYGFFGIQF